MYDKVVGSSVMVVGDLHFSDVFTGKHKNYLENCFWCLSRITEKLNEKKPAALVLLGDIVGWTETNVKDRQVFSMFCKVLRDWNQVCPVYAVRGNHDLKGYPDFQFLADFGLIITASSCGGHFDYFGVDGQEKPEVRFHLVDYKCEDKPLALAGEGTSNIILAHNNFTINGVTNWYNAHDGLELCMQSCFTGADMVISGHIHNPSPEIYSATMQNGESCMLFYPGCPTRTSVSDNDGDSVWYVFVEYNKSDGETEINTEPFALRPADEVFYKSDEFVTDKTKEEVENELRREALKDVLGDLLTYRMNTGSPVEQVMRIPNASDAAKQIAVEYLQLAFNRG